MNFCNLQEPTVCITCPSLAHVCPMPEPRQVPLLLLIQDIEGELQHHHLRVGLLEDVKERSVSLDLQLGQKVIEPM